MSERVAVIGPGRIGRQIALAWALGGRDVVLIDVKARPAGAASALDDAFREMDRDLGLMVEETLVTGEEAAATRARLRRGRGLAEACGCAFVQEALPEVIGVKRDVFKRLSDVAAAEAIVASTASTISPNDMADALVHPERFLVAHWLNPAHVIPLVEVVPSDRTDEAVVAGTVARLESLGKVAVRCRPSPGFIGPRLQVLLMNEAVRLVEEGVATAEDVDRAFTAGMGFRYAALGIFEFIDWGGVDILARASRYLAQATGDARFAAPRSVDDKMARNELGPKTGRGFYDYAGARREQFETDKMRRLLRQLRRAREAG